MIAIFIHKGIIRVAIKGVVPIIYVDLLIVLPIYNFFYYDSPEYSEKVR